MEQWVLNGRNLIRQRDPVKFGFAGPAVERVVRRRDPAVDCLLSRLLGPTRCRVSAATRGSGDGEADGNHHEGEEEEELQFQFDCDDDGTTPTPRGFWAPARDLSGVFGFVQKVDCAIPPSAPLDEEGCPKPYAECVATVRWYLEGGMLADETEQMDFVAGAGTVPQAVEEGVLTMRAGTTAVFLVDPAFAFRENGQPRSSHHPIPPEAVLTLHLHLHTFTNPLTEAEKLQQATELKNEGNAAVQRQAWDEAMGRYQRGLSRLSPGSATAPERPEDATVEARAQRRAAMQAVKVTLLHNIAVAIMGRNSITATAAEQAIAQCTRGLSIDPAHAKCRYRRALAHLQKRDFDAATNDAAYLQKNSLGDPVMVETLLNRIRVERGGGGGSA